MTIASNAPHPMAATESPDPRIAPRRRSRAGAMALLWLILIAALAFGGWKLRGWWRANMSASPPVATLAPDASADDASADNAAVGDVAAAIRALRRDQRALAQRMSDATSSNQVLRDEVLGVGERAALIEQSVARIASPRAQGEPALRLDEAELLLTIGQQQLELSANVGNALHAYALADSTLAGSTDPSVVNLRQSLAQETAALRALPPDPRAAISGRLDAFEATLNAQPFATATPHAQPASVFDRVVGSMVEVHRAQSQELLDPATRDAGLTAIRLEITLARLALERRDTAAFHAALARIDGWLPRLFSPTTVADQRRQLAELQRAPLKIELPSLGGTLAELRRLRQAQPDVPAPPASTPTAPAPKNAAPVPATHP